MDSYFFTLFLIVFSCLGFTISSQEGYLLYFMRKPFESLYDSNLRKHKILIYLFKPVLLCITCMASVWGVSIYLFTHEQINLFELSTLILSSSFIQTFIYKLYAKLD